MSEQNKQITRRILVELFELLAREQADEFSKRAEAARINTQAVASNDCVGGGVFRHAAPW